MHLTSIALILLSAICHALWNFYSKSSRDIRILFFWCGFYTIAIAFIAFGIKQPVIPKPVWIYILGSAFCPPVIQVVFDARLYGWRDFVCLSDYTCRSSLLATLCLSFFKGANLSTRHARHLMCDGIHSALSTTRGAYPAEDVL